jgi:hypothetical protein
VQATAALELPKERVDLPVLSVADAKDGLARLLVNPAQRGFFHLCAKTL